MTVSRSELHDLVDELPDGELARAAADLRRHLTAVDSPVSPPFSWIGTVDNPDVPEDLTENLDAYMTDFGRHPR
ncbi:MAG: hypothetical protein QM597_03980 [Aeromicrobium sp.]|uniref:hypothetical protein n=1 Tax=Aeromicrobium sp. TaxID=1871063 RepID=UPI0039E2CC68